MVDSATEIASVGQNGQIAAQGADYAALQASLEAAVKRQLELTSLAQRGDPPKVAEALKGNNTTVGQMNDAEKRALVSDVVDTWDKQSTGWNNRSNSQTGLRNAAALRAAVQGDAQLSSLVKEVYSSKPLNAVIYYNNDAPGKDVNNSFDKAAYTQGRRTGGNNPDIYTPVLKDTDFKAAWNDLSASGRPLVGVAYFGHNSLDANNNGVLYFKDSKMNAADVLNLPKANYTQGATIEFHVCRGAMGSSSTAQSLANSQGVTVVAESGKSYFSTSDASWNLDYTWNRGNIKDDPNWTGDLFLGAYDHDFNCNAFTELGCSWQRLPGTVVAPQKP